MLSNIANVGKDCVGCGNCSLVCPKHVIDMKSNDEGFRYPVMNTKDCINCSRCIQACPQMINIQDSKIGSGHNPRGYIAITKDKMLYRRSASGGIFATIAYEFLSKEKASYVCGAAYIDGVVQHIMINKQEEIKLLQGSKYVQSELGDLFVQIKQKLSDGADVLFSGTPCQVASLKRYLGDDYKDLYTIDLVCHGVPSPEFLKKDFEIYKGDSSISELSFRKKHKFYKSKSNYFLSLKRENGKKVVGVPYNRDPYFNLFMSGMTFRYSCYQCHYANLHRPGDLTIGDCDSASVYPNFYKNEATSVIIENSAQGSRLLAYYKERFDMMQIDLALEASKNHQLSEPFPMPWQRKEIYHRIQALSVEEIRAKYAKPRTVNGLLFQVINMLLPYGLVSILLHRGRE